MRFSYTHTLLGAALITGWCAGAPQTWTSTDGRSIEGEFVRCFGNTVTIKKPNGINVSVMLNSLNEPSREQVKRLALGPKAATAMKAQGTTPSSTKTGPLSLSPAKNASIPSDEEISAFLTQYKATPESDETTDFNASFSVAPMKPDDAKSYARKGRVPFRITVDLLRSKTVGGNRRYSRVDGQATIVLLNEAGDVVDRKREALGKLCPS